MEILLFLAYFFAEFLLLSSMSTHKQRKTLTLRIRAGSVIKNDKG